MIIAHISVLVSFESAMQVLWISEGIEGTLKTSKVVEESKRERKRERNGSIFSEEKSFSFSSLQESTLTPLPLH
jgi:hypothetical protein